LTEGETAPDFVPPDQAGEPSSSAICAGNEWVSTGGARRPSAGGARRRGLIVALELFARRAGE
jgi:hypothetical protein